MLKHDDKTDATVWGLTYFQSHMMSGSSDAADSLRRQSHMKSGRGNLFSEFTEMKPSHNTAGRRSLFGARNSGEADEAYRMGQRSGLSRNMSDMTHDQGLD